MYIHIYIYMYICIYVYVYTYNNLVFRMLKPFAGSKMRTRANTNIQKHTKEIKAQTVTAQDGHSYHTSQSVHTFTCKSILKLSPLRLIHSLHCASYIPTPQLSLLHIIHTNTTALSTAPHTYQHHSSLHCTSYIPTPQLSPLHIIHTNITALYCATFNTHKLLST